jgi:hypothetical protein
MSVAKSIHAGLPWLRYISLRASDVHFWPFDGWEIPTKQSVAAEVYPSLWSRDFACEGRSAIAPFGALFSSCYRFSACFARLWPENSLSSIGLIPVKRRACSSIAAEGRA